MDIETLKQEIRSCEQTARAMRERSEISLADAEQCDERAEAFRKQLAELEKASKK